MVHIRDILMSVQHKDHFPFISGALILFQKLADLSFAVFLKGTKSWLNGPFLLL